MSSAVVARRVGNGRGVHGGHLRRHCCRSHRGQRIVPAGACSVACPATAAGNGSLLGGRSARTGGVPSISGCKANICPHFQQRFTAPSNSSPHLEHRTAILFSG